jgi:hypothetical protein
MRKSSSRSWINIAHDDCFTSGHQKMEVVQGLVEMIVGRVFLEGWNPHFLTFQFHQLPGNANHILARMRTEIEIFYRKLISRVQRFPRTRLGFLNSPILLASGDVPIPKHKKRTIAEVTINDGLHQHGILLLPSTSRLRTDLATHFTQEQERYRKGSHISSVSVDPIELTHRDVETVVRYTCKGWVEGRLGFDESILWLPRVVSELPD